jgi:hypothetical protein
VQVGVADAAKSDVDPDVVVARRAAGDIQRFEGFVGGLCAICLDSHGSSFPTKGRMVMAKVQQKRREIYIGL